MGRKPDEIKFLVDKEDLETVNKYRWYCNGGYARGWVNGKKIYMHQLLMNSFGKEVDHINRDKLDNRRCNLRLCLHCENTRNSIPKNKRANPKGIQFLGKNRWRAFITNHYKFIHLGVFKTKIMAARAYDGAALQLFGKFSRTNYAIQ